MVPYKDWENFFDLLRPSDNNPTEKSNKRLYKDLSNFCVYRRGRSEVFCKKGVLRNFGKFTGKHLCQGLLFNKVAGLKPVWPVKP